MLGIHKNLNRVLLTVCQKSHRNTQRKSPIIIKIKAPKKTSILPFQKACAFLSSINLNATLINFNAAKKSSIKTTYFPLILENSVAEIVNTNKKIQVVIVSFFILK